MTEVIAKLGRGKREIERDTLFNGRKKKKRRLLPVERREEQTTDAGAMTA